MSHTDNTHFTIIFSGKHMVTTMTEVIKHCAISAYTMKAYWGSGGIAPLIL
jgi:hypothetical protein